MAQFENPDQGRAQYYEDAEIFQIRIKRKSNIFVVVFMMFWLGGWVFGEVMVLGALLGGGTGAASFFMLFWLGGWTIGGLYVLQQVLWGLAGYELVTLSKDALTLERYIPVYRRSWSYDLTRAANIRAESAKASGTVVASKQIQPGIFSSRNLGSVRFDYGVQTPAFGFDLDEAEAHRVVLKLSEKLEKP